MNKTSPRVCVAATLAALLLQSATLTAAPSGMELARALNEAFVSVADKASASVVVVKVAQKAPEFEPFDEDNPFYDYFRHFFEEQQPAPRRRQRPPSEDPEQEPPARPRRQMPMPEFDGQGSGVIIRADGYILTNGHVVENAEKIRVRLKDGSEYDATIRGTDPQSDMAVLKIEATSLPAAKMGDSTKVRVGEFAIAIGAPFELDYSVTIGHVSAMGRSNIIRDPSMDQDFIQTDASINPGNSGGPLVNLDGEVIGINTMIRGMNTGIGFAVPANLAREVSNAIIEFGRFPRAWLGVRITALRDMPELKELVQLTKDGVVVRELVPNGPAAKAELKPSDIITSVEGRPVGTSQQLKDAIRTRQAGRSVTLEVVRGEEKIKVKVLLEEWPDESATLASNVPRQKTGERGLGITVKDLTREYADPLGARPGSGVVVTGVDEDSVAAEKGIVAGDIITEVNRKKVTSVREFRAAVAGADLKKGVILNYTSNGVSRFEVLKDESEP